MNIIKLSREVQSILHWRILRTSLRKGILALERNWRGQLADNHSVSTTLSQFQDIRRPAPILVNCRTGEFQHRTVSGNADAYVRSRLIFESGLEEQAMDKPAPCAFDGIQSRASKG